MGGGGGLRKIRVKLCVCVWGGGVLKYSFVFKGDPRNVFLNQSKIPLDTPTPGHK